MDSTNTEIHSNIEYGHHLLFSLETRIQIKHQTTTKNILYI